MSKRHSLMRKNENKDLYKPMRQSYSAIVLMAYRLYRVLIRQLFPFLIIFLFGGSSNKKNVLMYSIIVIAVLGFIYSVIAFFKYYFYLKEDKLIVEKGVFKKTKLEIPFERIQSVNYEQNIVHRIFGVVRVNMDTAGSAGSELQINALDKGLAQTFSDIILSHNQEQALPDTSSETERTIRNNSRRIFSLSIPQLLKVGATANHLRSGLVIVAFFFWIWDNISEYSSELQERIEDQIPDATEMILGSLFLVLILVVLFMVASFLISMVRTILTYYDLHMYRKGDGFMIQAGLLSRKQQAAKDHKIQIFRWTQNMLQKWTDVFELQLKQASSVAVSSNKSIKVVGMDEQDIKQCRHYLFDNHEGQIDDIEMKQVNKYYRFRRLYYCSLVALPIIAFFIWDNSYDNAMIACLLYVIGIVGCFLNYKKKSYGFSRKLLRINGGTFGRASTLLLIHKIQSLSIAATPFQRRRSLGSLYIHTASGSVSIPDIAHQECLRLKNLFISKVEGSRESWM